MARVRRPMTRWRVSSRVRLTANAAKGTEMRAPVHIGMNRTMLMVPPLRRKKTTAKRQVKASAKEVIPTEALVCTPLNI